jgi:hypothetical protein
MELLLVLLAVLIGGGLAYRFGGLTGSGPRWAQALLVAGVGIGLGIGITGCVFFLGRTFVPSPYFSPGIEAALAAWLAWEVFRTPRPSATSAGSLNWMIVLGLGVVLAFAIGAFAEAWSDNPQGSWDAFSIWNLRAKFLVSSDGLAARAWSPLLKYTHPEYPLLLPSFIARGWAYSGSISEVTPIATSFLFFLGMLAMGVGALSIWRAPSLGLAFGVILGASPSLLHEVPAQYADIPLAYFFVGAVAMALLDRPLLAGAFAGIATFTKNEGAVFLARLLLAVVIAKRGAVRFLAAAAPFATLSAVFKLVLALGINGIKTGAANTNQVGEIASAFVKEFINLGAGFYHPLLPVAALAFIWGLDSRFRPQGITAIAISLAMLASYFTVFMFTANDLSWQLGTALARLYVQVWPTALFGCIFLLRSPDEKLARS